MGDVNTRTASANQVDMYAKMDHVYQTHAPCITLIISGGVDTDQQNALGMEIWIYKLGVILREISMLCHWTQSCGSFEENVEWPIGKIIGKL